MLGEIDELPYELVPISVRRLLWKEYGIVLPDFTGDDAIDALILNDAEKQREQELERKRARQINNYG